MSLRQKLKHEIAALAVVTVYFGCWVAGLHLLKQLVLAEYRIETHDWATALMGVLVLSKVVLVLEHVSFGAWVRARPAWVDVVLRTLSYALGVVVVLVLEKAFEGRHEHGGFLRSLTAGVEEAEVHHVWANVIGVSGALLVYNVLTVIRRHLGERGLLRMFLSPLPAPPRAKAPPTAAAGS